MSETIAIQIKIADRIYPLKVQAADENKVKQAAEQINLHIKDLMQKYDGRDMQDYMAMFIMLQMNNALQNPFDVTQQPIQLDFKSQLNQIAGSLDDLLK
jgi:cell division protein ZapA